VSRSHAVLFDFFGVLCPDLASLTGAQFSRAHGLDPVEFSRFTHQYRGALDRNEMSESELSQAIIDHFNLNESRDVLEAGLQALNGRYYALDHHLYSIIDQLKSQAIVGLMSNVSQVSAQQLRHLGAYDKFDRLFLSSDYGLTKSDPAWFEKVADELDLAPQNCILIDDAQWNVATAKAAGWKHSIVYQSPAHTAAALRAAGFQLKTAPS